MNTQEVIAFAIVLSAVIYAARQFIRQFTHGDGAASKCGKCELNKAVMKSAKK